MSGKSQGILRWMISGNPEQGPGRLHVFSCSLWAMEAITDTLAAFVLFD